MHKPIRSVVLEVPESELKRLKQHLEANGRYMIYDAAPFYKDMLQFMVTNGFDSESQVEWEEKLSMDHFIQIGCAIKRSEPYRKPTFDRQYLKNNLTDEWFEQTKKWVTEFRRSGLPDLDEHFALRERLFLLLEDLIDKDDNEPFNAMMGILSRIFAGTEYTQG
jgi:hypothetical protein